MLIINSLSVLKLDKSFAIFNAARRSVPVKQIDREEVSTEKVSAAAIYVSVCVCVSGQLHALFLSLDGRHCLFGNDII